MCGNLFGSEPVMPTAQVVQQQAPPEPTPPPPPPAPVPIQNITSMTTKKSRQQGINSLRGFTTQSNNMLNIPGFNTGNNVNLPM